MALRPTEPEAAGKPSNAIHDPIGSVPKYRGTACTRDEMARSVTLRRLTEASRDLAIARSRYAEARNAVFSIRSSVGEAIDEAFRIQSFEPIQHLLEQEEAAVTSYQAAMTRLLAAEQRWYEVSAALGHLQDTAVGRRSN